MKVVLIVFCLFISQNSFSFTDDLDVLKVKLSDFINRRTLGLDPIYGKIVTPSLSLETGKTKNERILSENNKLIEEMSLVLSAFDKADAVNTVTSVYSAVKQIDAEVLNGNGHIIFQGTSPSSAQSRNLYLIPKSKVSNGGLLAQDVMNTLTSYKRSAKSSDYLYEYDSAFDLQLGQPQEIVGTETSWIGAEAAAPFKSTEDYAIKKCRKLLGWRCVTSIYRTDSVQLNNSDIQILYINLYDLTQAKDNKEFADDKRSYNQITGSTAIYMVRESADWIMIYGADYQYNADKTTFTGAIQTEFQKDNLRFKNRLSADFGIPASEIK